MRKRPPTSPRILESENAIPLGDLPAVFILRVNGRRGEDDEHCHDCRTDTGTTGKFQARRAFSFLFLSFLQRISS